MAVSRRAFLEGLAMTAGGLLVPRALSGIEPGGGDPDPHPGPGGNPGGNPDPGPGPGPGPGPTPGPGGGAPVDLLPFLYMNMVKAPKKKSTFKTPMHMEGIGRCLSINSWGCDAVGTQGGAWHNYVVTPNHPWVGWAPTHEIIFTKAPGGGGLEHHLAADDRIAIWLENMDWDRTNPAARFREFKDDLGRLGAIWVRRNWPTNTFFHEGGHQDWYTCGNPTFSSADYALDNVWALHGAYAIDTPEGRDRATYELQQYVPGNLPVIYPEWLTIKDKLPGLPAGCHTYLVARPDGWSGLPGISDPSELEDYRMREVYFYLLVAPSPDMAGIAAGGRGLGMVRWIARDVVEAGFMKEVALLNPIVDGRLYYDNASVCRDRPLSAALMGIGSSRTAKKERKARAIYDEEYYGSMGQMRAPIVKRIEREFDLHQVRELMYDP